MLLEKLKYGNYKSPVELEVLSALCINHSKLRDSQNTSSQILKAVSSISRFIQGLFLQGLPGTPSNDEEQEPEEEEQEPEEEQVKDESAETDEQVSFGNILSLLSLLAGSSKSHNEGDLVQQGGSDLDIDHGESATSEVDVTSFPVLDVSQDI